MAVGRCDNRDSGQMAGVGQLGCNRSTCRTIRLNTNLNKLVFSSVQLHYYEVNTVTITAGPVYRLSCTIRSVVRPWSGTRTKIQT